MTTEALHPAGRRGTGRVRHPLVTVAVVVAALLVPLPVLSMVDYRGSSDLHAGVEVIGALIALTAAVTVMVRYSALGERTHLFYALAFVANAAGDLVHGLVSYAAGRELGRLPLFTLEELVPDTYVTGRFAMAVLLLLGPLLGRRIRRLEGRDRVRLAAGASLAVLVAVALLTIVAGEAASVPAMVIPEGVFARPLDLASGAIFLAAVGVLLRHHERTGDRVTWVVAVAAAFGVGSQVTIALSSQLFDVYFDLAHLYKVAGYTVPLVAFSLYHVRVIDQRDRYAAELELASEAKSQFVSVVSHELRTPLTSILGFTSMLTEFWDETPEEDKRNYVAIVERQADRLSRLVNDLLAISRLESGVIDARREDLELAPLVIEAATGVVDGDVVTVDVTSGLRVHADPDHLHQIMVNLVSNARKYGEPPIVVSARADDGAVVMTVADHGQGVPATFRPRLFERFAQADSGYTRNAQGTGLGLAITRGLVRAQGGDIWYEDNQPRGARFCVRLPAGRDQGIVARRGEGQG